MKKLYLPLLLAISFVSKAQILDSTKNKTFIQEKTKINFSYISPFKALPKNNSVKTFNQNIDKSLIFPSYYTQKVDNDIQKNLSQLNSRFTINPYQIPKTLTNPNGSATPKQATISGLLKGMTR